ncbi:hypothetical protein L873DRAFT_1793879 [Choiromyces venosus 120613-1]|uniref:CHAT domain-containing protein n=1 Tax=Choiromyces venosus 120613-1 TaxID=1336337 RepID=A0A3N4J4J6_9PEZI|nr:hypothetical protein L873DRAFT_1793879 [Choiromyces venosus 120613-1]
MTEILGTSSEQTDDTDVLNEAIALTARSLTEITTLHPNRAILSVKLRKIFGSKFEHSQDEVDLDMAWHPHYTASIEEYTQSVQLPGMALFRRYERLGNVSDLSEAIIEMEKAREAYYPGDTGRVNMQESWIGMLEARYERLGDMNDLERAADKSEEILRRSLCGGPSHFNALGSLEAILWRRFERIGDLEDVQNAIKHGEEALATTPRDHPVEQTDTITWESCSLGDHPDRAGIYNNLGGMFYKRFKRIGDLEDLQKAIKHSEEALSATPQVHAGRAGFYLNLGMSVESRYMCANSVEDFNECLRIYCQAWHFRTSPPRDRIRAAPKAAHLLYLGGRFHESSSLLEDAIHLMPGVNLQLSKRDDQQHILSELSGLATAASMALQAGREAYQNLKLLELGRGIILGFTIDSGSDAPDLKVDHELEYDQFYRLRVEIDSPTDEMNSVTGETQDQRRNHPISRRMEVVNEVEKVLTRIRNLPGYTRFLLPPSREALMNMAANGSIVIFNSTSIRSDAIIVTTSAITSLELTKLNQKETDHWMRKLASFGGGGGFKRGQDSKQMNDLLIWLWDAAVGPVFDHLEHTGTITSNGVDNTTLNRIWWIGVGQLSQPISTYIPTIKALSHACEQNLQLFDEYPASLSTECSRNARLLLVPMPETPGAISLPGVDTEVQYNRDSAARSGIEISVLSNPTPAEVPKKVQHYGIAHFACHGVSDVNPLDSHLILLTPDGNNSDKLQVLARDISSLNTPGAQLASLSACSSAKNTSTDLADEVIHLASPFELSGFSHTLSNIWETKDQASSEVARDFYNLLFQDQENVDDHYRVAAALHEAVKRVRDKRPHNYLVWAPFVHTGA